MPKRPTWSRSLLPISACRGPLRDVKVPREQLRTIAEHTMHDPWTDLAWVGRAGPEDILEILEMAW